MAELNARVPTEDETRTRLRNLKVGAERYDDVLNRLIGLEERLKGLSNGDESPEDVLDRLVREAGCDEDNA